MWRWGRVCLAGLLLCAGAGGSGAEPVSGVMCAASGGTYMVWSCGDPETEAQLRAQAMTPDEARSVGCPPVYFGRGPEQDEETWPVLVPTGEPSLTPRTPDPAVAGRVGAAWDRIERWLGAHASATLRKLRHPVDGDHLARWERDNGRLPDDLFASLQRHDGADGNFGAGFPLPPELGLARLSSFGSLRSSNCQDLVMSGAVDEADPDDGAWHGSLLPFASDGHGWDLFADPRNGRVGEKKWDERVRYDGPMGWRSFADLLEALAASMEQGQAVREWYPSVSAGCELRWTTTRPPSLPSGCAGSARPSPTPEPTPEAEEPSPLTDADARGIGCRPPRRPPVVRTPDPAVTRKVDAAWRRIERWLLRRAPRSHRTLRAPARPLDIARAEARMGLTFPDDLRASLLRHDGAGIGPGPLWLYAPAKEIAAEWSLMCGLYLDGTITPDVTWWHGRLIPYAPSNDGGHLFLDTGTGRTGEYYNETGLTLEGDPVWPSYLAQLSDLATSLETGRPMRSWKPTVVKGELDWTFVR
uniref:SMI1/KNR4 family protein n=1 Tax=Nonomuraea pusilla TaxID=46177 RepID=UPI000A8291C2|nr:SMI1/KNR4 family protein [Nonomuraea pusilla]